MAVRNIFKCFEKMILTRNPNSSGMAETSNAVIAGNGREGVRIDIEFKVINQFFQICCFSSVQLNRFLVVHLGVCHSVTLRPIYSYNSTPSFELIKRESSHKDYIP